MDSAAPLPFLEQHKGEVAIYMAYPLNKTVHVLA